MARSRNDGHGEGPTFDRGRVGKVASSEQRVVHGRFGAARPTASSASGSGDDDGQRAVPSIHKSCDQLRLRSTPRFHSPYDTSSKPFGCGVNSLSSRQDEAM